MGIEIKGQLVRVGFPPYVFQTQAVRLGLSTFILSHLFGLGNSFPWRRWFLFWGLICFFFFKLRFMLCMFVRACLPVQARDSVGISGAGVKRQV